MVNITDVEAAYLAGFLDGDGSLGLAWNGRRQSAHIIAKVSFYNSNQQAINYIANLIDKQPYTVRYRPRTDNRWYHTKPMLTIGLSGRRALDVIERLYPYLIVKRPQADIVLEFYRNPVTAAQRSGKRLPQETVDARLTALEQLKAIK